MTNVTDHLSSPIRVALYGDNGHQIQRELENHPLARLVAVAAFPREKLGPALQGDPEIRSYATLDELLSDSRVDLISFCSPRREDQAAEAIRALRAGKHVYAEKPCAMTEADLDAIQRAVTESGRSFHEMAGTAFQQPYYAMRQLVQAGRIGKVIHVTSEKSYPYQPWRPQDESVDGGLIEQCAIHAFRFVEHVAGVRIQSVHTVETSAGNPVAEGGLRMAASLIVELEGGAVGAISANYLNPTGTGVWGYESLRIWGTEGMIESARGGTVTRLVVGEKDFGPLDVSAPEINFLDAYLRTLLGKGTMPLTLEEELSPTRWVIRAKQGL